MNNDENKEPEKKKRTRVPSKSSDAPKESMRQSQRIRNRIVLPNQNAGNHQEQEIIKRVGGNAKKSEAVPQNMLRCCSFNLLGQSLRKILIRDSNLLRQSLMSDSNLLIKSLIAYSKQERAHEFILSILFNVFFSNYSH